MEKRLIGIIALCILICGVVLFTGCRAREEAKHGEEASSPEQIHEDEYSPADTIQTDSADALVKPSSTIAEYKYTWSDSKSIPPLVIIVDDFGYTGGELLTDFAQLPKEVTFAVLPDLPNTALSGKVASANGHDVIIHVPMEAKTSTTSPGKKYIKTGMEAGEIAGLLEDFKAQLPMAIAANNHMGSTATADESVMTAVLDKLNGMGMYFIDSATSASRLSYNLAKSKGYKSLRRDIFLDVPDSKDATIATKIQSLGKYQGRNEPVVIITHCHNREKLNALRQFIAQVKAMGVRIISLSEAQATA